MDAMTDIESLGTASGSAIIAIGAACFDLQHVYDDEFHKANPESNMPKPFYQSITPGHELTMDFQTIKWWMKQSTAAQAVFFDPDAVNLFTALMSFKDWCHECGVKKIWGHGSTFDITLLEAAYDKCSMQYPWDFRAPRDTRTIFDMTGVKVEKYGVEHNALDDAIGQAYAVQKAKRMIIDGLKKV